MQYHVQWDKKIWCLVGYLEISTSYLYSVAIAGIAFYQYFHYLKSPSAHDCLLDFRLKNIVKHNY